MNKFQSLVKQYPKLSVAVTVLLGIFLGVSVFTFQYAEGLSYFSKDPQACTNCHIMQPEFDSWQKSSHHTVAACVDCHLPHSFIEKYIAKADNGFRHSKGFTLQDFLEPIVLTEKNKAILQDNCVRCHEGLVHELILPEGRDLETLKCTHCHSDVGHGELVRLGRIYDHLMNKNFNVDGGNQ